eukprot:419836-Rhodomonas_salina.3
MPPVPRVHLIRACDREGDCVHIAPPYREGEGEREREREKGGGEEARERERGKSCRSGRRGGEEERGEERGRCREWRRRGKGAREGEGTGRRRGSWRSCQRAVSYTHLRAHETEADL